MTPLGVNLVTPLGVNPVTPLFDNPVTSLGDKPMTKSGDSNWLLPSLVPANVTWAASPARPWIVPCYDGLVNVVS